MPVVNWELREVQKNITRPVIDAVARDYFELLGLSGSKIEVRYMGDGGAISVPGSSTDKPYQFVRLPTDEYLEVTYDEEYDENAIRSTPIHRKEAPYIFLDPTTGIVLTPVRQELKGTITIRIHAADKQRIGILLRKYKTLVSRDVDQVGHKLAYSYDVPPPILTAMADFYKLRENRSGYMDTYDDWFNNNFIPRKVTAYSLDGKNPVCKIAETSIRTVTYFEEGDVIPKKDKEDETGAYFAELRIGFYWQRVESMDIYYPTVIHNQTVPEKYLLIDRYKALFGGQYMSDLYEYYPTNGENEFGQGGLRTELLDNFGYAFRGSDPAITFNGVQDPVWMEWMEPIPGGPYPGYRTFIRQQVLKDFDDDTYLNTLGSFWHFDLSEHALEYIQGTKATVKLSNHNVFSVTAYKRDRILDQRDLIIDDCNDIRLNKPVGDRDEYQLIYSICTDPSRLTSEARLELGCYPMFFYDYLCLISPDVACRFRLKIEQAINAQEEGEDVCLPDWLIGEIFEEVWKETNTVGYSKGLIMKTVALFDIVSQKKGVF